MLVFMLYFALLFFLVKADLIEKLFVNKKGRFVYAVFLHLTGFSCVFCHKNLSWGEHNYCDVV